MLADAKRFIQRVESYSRAFNRLEELINMISGQHENRLFGLEESGLQVDIVREALIKRFEFTQELSWNVLKDLLSYEGEVNLAGSRDTYRRALRYGIIDSPVWMEMINDRNLSAHDYYGENSAMIAERIMMNYYPLLRRLYNDMRAKTAIIGLMITFN